MRRGPSVVLLLLGVNAFVLVLPIAALAFRRIYDTYLLRQTERQLITQSVVIAEAFRQAWWDETGRDDDQPRPPRRTDDRYVTIEPLIDIGTEIGPPEEVENLPEAPPGDTPERRAGTRIEPLLRRAQIFNLSGIRVLDAQGCVVATTGGQAGRCMTAVTEVANALRGTYAAKARHRISDEPTPVFGDIRRRGRLRVFIALPVFSDGRVIGVVAVQRTGLDALSSLWQIRRRLLSSLLLVVSIVVVISLLFARAIAKPVLSIAQKAQAVAAGQEQPHFAVGGWTPAEIRTLSEFLDVMTDKLQTRARYVSEFATNVSHELKTPISAIRGASELLQEGWESMEPAQRARFVDNIALDAQRMDRLVTRLLALARIENTALPDATTVEVLPFCRAVLERWEGEVELIVESPPQRLRIIEERLATVLGNLTDNAVRHGAGQAVQVTLGSAEGRLLIRVTDHGPGISEANRRRIWERFFTTQRDKGGTGLGLAMVKAIADARSGRVDFESSSEGTTFSVVL